MKYCPIGTVVVLKNGTWPLMIYGRQQITKKNPDILYNYVGCLYPQGYIDKDYIVFFQHNDIDKILHKGMASSAETDMEKLLHIPKTV